MTMIATALSDDFIVQVVDRRLSRGGILYDDTANKAICGIAADASFSLAYTGLMMTPLRTDRWITKFLSANQLLSQPFPVVLDRLATELSVEFRKFTHLSPKDRRLTLAFAGFSNSGQPFAATISNQEDSSGRVLSEPIDQFAISFRCRNGKQMRKLDVVIHGAEAAIDDDLKRVIGKIRRAMFNKPGTRIASAFVAVVRLAAKHSAYGHLISPNCVSIVHAKASREISCSDHLAGEDPTKHFPDFVTSNMSFQNIWVNTDKPKN